MMKEELESI